LEIISKALTDDLFNQTLQHIWGQPHEYPRNKLLSLVFSLELQKTTTIRSKLEIIKRQVTTEALEKAFLLICKHKGESFSDNFRHRQLYDYEQALKNQFRFLISPEAPSNPKPLLYPIGLIMDYMNAIIQADLISHPEVSNLAQQEASLKDHLMAHTARESEFFSPLNDTAMQANRHFILKNWLESLGLL
jgi:hypothetical protein